MTGKLGVVIPLQLGLLIPFQMELFGVALPLLLLLAGTGLIVAEALAPGANFIVLGIALFLAGGIGVLASGTALAVLASPIGLTAMVLIFAVATFYVYSEFDIYGGKSSGRTSDSDSLRGQTGRVTETVTATDGEVKLDDGGFNPHYSARSVDGSTIDPGTEVVVIDPGGGNVVTVQSVETETMDEIDRALSRSRVSDSPPADSAPGEPSPEQEEIQEQERETETE